jgi:hypothetical protein
VHIEGDASLSGSRYLLLVRHVSAADTLLASALVSRPHGIGLTGDPDQPVRVREEDLASYRVGSGGVWRMGKKRLGAVLPARFEAGQPFHAGPTWLVMESGLNVMSKTFAD